MHTGGSLHKFSTCLLGGKWTSTCLLGGCCTAVELYKEAVTLLYGRVTAVQLCIQLYGCTRDSSTEDDGEEDRTRGRPSSGYAQPGASSATTVHVQCGRRLGQHQISTQAAPPGLDDGLHVQLPLTCTVTWYGRTLIYYHAAGTQVPAAESINPRYHVKHVPCCENCPCGMQRGIDAHEWRLMSRRVCGQDKIQCDTLPFLESGLPGTFCRVNRFRSHACSAVAVTANTRFPPPITASSSSSCSPSSSCSRRPAAAQPRRRRPPPRPASPQRSLSSQQAPPAPATPASTPQAGAH